MYSEIFPNHLWRVIWEEPLIFSLYMPEIFLLYTCNFSPVYLQFPLIFVKFSSYIPEISPNIPGIIFLYPWNFFSISLKFTFYIPEISPIYPRNFLLCIPEISSLYLWNFLYSWHSPFVFLNLSLYIPEILPPYLHFPGEISNILWKIIIEFSLYIPKFLPLCSRNSTSIYPWHFSPISSWNCYFILPEILPLYP